MCWVMGQLLGFHGCIVTNSLTPVPYRGSSILVGFRGAYPDFVPGLFHRCHSMYFDETLAVPLTTHVKVGVHQRRTPTCAGEACPALTRALALSLRGLGAADIMPKFYLPRKPLGRPERTELSSELSPLTGAPKTPAATDITNLILVCRDYVAPTRPQRQLFSSSSACAGRPCRAGSRFWISCYPYLPGQPAPHSSAPVMLHQREQWPTRITIRPLLPA
jgi:hypothetical protein